MFVCKLKKQELLSLGIFGNISESEIGAMLNTA